MARRLPSLSGPAGLSLLLVLLLTSFGRLVLHPSALLVDADRPSLDHARRSEDAPTIGNDATRLFLPHHLWIARQVAQSGRVPTWDDRGFGGRPLVGNPQAGLFYPPTWLVWWFWTPSLLGWLTVAHLFSGALGTWLLCRSLAIDRWGSWIAAGCFQANPYILAQVFEGHYPHVWSASWMPWAFLAALQLHRGRWLFGLMLAPILALAAFAGHPQEAYFLVVALGLWACQHILVRMKCQGVKASLPWLGAWVGIGILTLGITAVEWLPDLLASRWTLRTSIYSAEQAARYHLYPINALQLLSPFALGGPSDFIGHDNFWETTTSIGLIPLCLVVVALIWGQNRRTIRAWTWLVLLCVWFAAGRQLGLFSLFYRVLPGIDHFRVPARTLFLASLGLSVLAGIGAQTLRQLADSPELWIRWTRLTSRFTFAIILIVLIGGSIPGRPFTFGANQPRLSEAERVPLALARIREQPTFWMALVVLALSFGVRNRTALTKRRYATWLGCAALLELTAYGYALNVVSPQQTFFEDDPISQTLRVEQRKFSEPILIRAVDDRYDDLRCAVNGFRKTNVNDSFQLQHVAPLYEPLYRLFWESTTDRDRPMDRATELHRRLEQQRSLDRMGVQFLVSDREVPDNSWHIVERGHWRKRPYFIWQNPTARAHTVFKSDTGEVSEVEGMATPSKDNEKKLTLSASAPGVLHFRQAWMPGWTATEEGRRLETSADNDGLLAIRLSQAGNHRLEIEYEAPGLTVGKGITEFFLTSWSACMVLFYRVLRAKQVKVGG